MSHLDFTVTFPSTTGWTIVAAKLILAPGSVDKFSSSLLFFLPLRLGPCNTQLMRAYYDFDPRLALLIPTVRMWARSAGLSRASLNNYAVSLLLIYALQHATPPVLPCLQNPGAWPRNMDWFATRGFTAAADGVSQGRVSPGGWNCGFTPPGSLVPSCNTASAGEAYPCFPLLSLPCSYLAGRCSCSRMVHAFTLSLQPSCFCTSSSSTQRSLTLVPMWWLSTTRLQPD